MLIAVRKPGVLECWSVGVLECWSVGVLECWSVGVLEVYSPFGKTRSCSPSFQHSSNFPFFFVSFNCVIQVYRRVILFFMASDGSTPMPGLSVIP